jgi:DNA-binding XRE family transcriptional regulator
VRGVDKRGSAKQGSDLLPPPETWLNRYRREAGLNQDALATAAGISVRTLQRLESTKYSAEDNPPVRYLISCAVALGLEDWHLLLEDRWRKPLPGACFVPPRWS